MIRSMRVDFNTAAQKIIDQAGDNVVQASVKLKKLFQSILRENGPNKEITESFRSLRRDLRERVSSRITDNLGKRGVNVNHLK